MTDKCAVIIRKFTLQSSRIFNQIYLVSLNKQFDLNDLHITADRRLFQKVCLFDHYIYRLLPGVKTNVSHPRPRGHPFVLPGSCSTLARNDLINRCLLNFV